MLLYRRGFIGRLPCASYRGYLTRRGSTARFVGSGVPQRVPHWKLMILHLLVSFHLCLFPLLTVTNYTSFVGFTLFLSASRLLSQRKTNTHFPRCVFPSKAQSFSFPFEKTRAISLSPRLSSFQLLQPCRKNYPFLWPHPSRVNLFSKVPYFRRRFLLSSIVPHASFCWLFSTWIEKNFHIFQTFSLPSTFFSLLTENVIFSLCNFLSEIITPTWTISFVSHWVLRDLQSKLKHIGQGFFVSLLLFLSTPCSCVPFGGIAIRIPPNSIVFLYS